MSKSNVLEASIQALLFTRAPIANIADDAVTSPAANFYFSLHSASPGEGGSQNTSELTYTGYARVAVVRSGSGFTLAADVASNAAVILFGACTAGGPQTAAYWGVGLSSSGAGILHRWGAITTPLVINTGVAPQFAIGAWTSSED